MKLKDLLDITLYADISNLDCDQLVQLIDRESFSYYNFIHGDLCLGGIPTGKDIEWLYSREIYLVEITNNGQLEITIK